MQETRPYSSKTLALCVIYLLRPYLLRDLHIAVLDIHHHQHRVRLFDKLVKTQVQLVAPRTSIVQGSNLYVPSSPFGDQSLSRL